MLDSLIKADHSATDENELTQPLALAQQDESPTSFSIENLKPGHAGPASPGWVVSRTRDSETKRFRVFHCAVRGCARVTKHRRRSALAPVEHVEDGISIHRGQDRQPAAIQGCCRNFPARA